MTTPSLVGSRNATKVRQRSQLLLRLRSSSLHHVLHLKNWDWDDGVVAGEDWPRAVPSSLWFSLCSRLKDRGDFFWPLLIRRYWKCHGVDRPLSWGRISISLAKSRRSCCWIGSTRCVVPVCAPRPGVPVSLDTHLYSLYVIHVTSCYMFISVYTLCHPGWH